MSEFRFDPPVDIAGSFVVCTLDDAAAFMRSHNESRLPQMRDSILRHIERAHGEAQQRKVAEMFRVWAKAEGVLPPV